MGDDATAHVCPRATATTAIHAGATASQAGVGRADKLLPLLSLIPLLLLLLPPRLLQCGGAGVLAAGPDAPTYGVPQIQVRPVACYSLPATACLLAVCCLLLPICYSLNAW